jgi:hypothetical protein
VAALALAMFAVAGSTANEGCIYDSALLELDGGSSSPPACQMATNAAASPDIPGQPAADDLSPTPDLTVVVAMQSIDGGVGVGADGGITTDGGTISPLAPQPHIGYDLDQRCTCCGAAPSCAQEPDSGENCDDDAGRDNTGIKLFRFLGASAQQGIQDVDQAMYSGLYGIVLQITHYNGQLNDKQVTVAVYASNGVAGPTGGGAPVVHHDGTDKWTVDPRYVTDGVSLTGTDCGNNPSCTPVFYDQYAYVACGVLVAHPLLQAVPFTFGGRAAFGGTVMLLQQPYIVGTLVQAMVNVGNGNSLSWGIVNGSVSGRWQSSDLLANMASIPDPRFPDAGVYICGTDSLYGPVKDFICALQDITSNSSKDNFSPMLYSCDSVSMAFGFTAGPAQLGVVAPIPPTPAGCQGTTGAAFQDTCGSSP